MYKSVRMSKVRELNVIRKKGKPSYLKIALLYPSLYHVALDTLSFHMLYYFINSRPRLIGERFNITAKSGYEPPPLSIESRSPLKNFDVIIISVHYEPDFVNIVRLLLAADVPVFSSNRNKPYIIVGGPAVISNPEPLAEIADVLALGEIEPILPFLLDKLEELHDNKGEFLDSLPPEKGFYVPVRNDEKIIVNKADRLTLDFHPITQIQPLDYGRRGRKTMVEAMRGCIRNCKFCLEGNIFKPKRERDFDQIRLIVDKSEEYNKTRKIVLLALSYFDHSQSDKILEYLVNNGYEVSVPSIRVETLSIDRLEMIVAGGQKTLTIAPETADVQLGINIGKPFVKSIIEELLSSAKKVGIKSVKLYFMIGLPGETDSHILKISEFIRDLSVKTGFKGVRELKVSFNPFIPKPHTPMQWFSFEDVATLKSKINFLRRNLGGLADVRFYDPKWAQVQAIISRGGREISNVIVAWATYGGGLGNWHRALKKFNINPRKYLGPLDPSMSLPWQKVVISY